MAVGPGSAGEAGLGAGKIVWGATIVRTGAEVSGGPGGHIAGQGFQTVA
jgi:hypothetical protein